MSGILPSEPNAYSAGEVLQDTRWLSLRTAVTDFQKQYQMETSHVTCLSEEFELPKKKTEILIWAKKELEHRLKKVII